GVAVGSGGNLYVVEQGNGTIRKITQFGTNWVVSTIAGLAFSKGTNDGVGSDARFNQPYGVAVDTAGNIYVADSFNHTIRKLTPVGTNWPVSPIAGLGGNLGTADGTNSAARFTQPMGITADTNGNVFVGDFVNDTIRKITPLGTNWVVSTLAGSAGSP